MRYLELIKSTNAFNNLSDTLKSAVGSPSIYPIFDDAIEWIEEGMEFEEWDKITTSGAAVKSIIKELFDHWDAENKEFHAIVLYEEENVKDEGFDKLKNNIANSLKLIPTSQDEVDKRERGIIIKTYPTESLNTHIQQMGRINRKPALTDAFNFNDLQELCTDYLNSFDKYQPNPNLQNDIFESAMQTFFGKDVFDYINSRTK